MADPTWAEAWIQFGNAAKILDALSTTAATVITLEDTLVQATEGDQAAAKLSAVRSLRQKLSSILSPSAVRELLEPHIRDMAKVISAPERDIPSIMQRIRDYQKTNDKDINQRTFTHGTPSAGSNTGNGTILRLLVDEDGNQISASHAELRTARCVLDASQTELEEEVFEFHGVDAEPDFLTVLGSGENGKRRISMLSARDSERMISNPSFSSDTAAAPATVLTGWTVGSAIGNFDISTAQTYRGFPGDSTQRSLKVDASDTIAQVLADVVGPTLRTRVPYWLQVAVYKPTGVTGNVILRLGATNRTVALSTLTNDAWSIVTIEDTSSPLTQALYLKQFNEASLDVKLEVTSLSGGSVYLDDVIVAPFSRFDNLWYLVVPAAAAHAAWLRDDVFTFTDSISGDAINSKWLWRGGFGWVRSIADASETDPDI